MSRKAKIKVKPGKAKIKLKSGDEALPLSDKDLLGLLGGAVASALAVRPELALPDTPLIGSGVAAEPPAS